MEEPVAEEPPRSPLRQAALAWVTRPRPVQLRPGPDRRPSSVVLRGGEPDDAAALARMHARCSMDTIFRRYLFAAPALAGHWQERLLSTTVVVVAVDGRGEVRALGNLVSLDEPGTAELAVLVEDRVQGHGLGTALARHLAAAARLTGHRTLRMDMLPSSTAAARVADRLGPSIAVVGVGVVTRTLPLRLESLTGLAAA